MLPLGTTAPIVPVLKLNPRPRQRYGHPPRAKCPGELVDAALELVGAAEMSSHPNVGRNRDSGRCPCAPDRHHDDHGQHSRISQAKTSMDVLKVSLDRRRTLACRPSQISDRVALGQEQGHFRFGAGETELRAKHGSGFIIRHVAWEEIVEADAVSTTEPSAPRICTDRLAELRHRRLGVRGEPVGGECVVDCRSKQ